MIIQKLSILVPCYNEEKMIGAMLSRLALVKLDREIQKEIIIADDCSADKTPEIIKQFIKANETLNTKYIRHEWNKGKGAAIKTALTQVTGDVIIIQDADLEYDPAEYNKLLKPILDGHADVVYGSRFRGSEAHRVLFFWHTIGNKILTFWSNVFTGLNLSDMESGYKMIKTDLLKSIRLKEKRFGFEPEVTAKLSHIKNIRFYEVGISYYGRNYSDGKKIGWRDGFHAFWCILKYNIFSRT
jgi:glycosyltransferase involved in cell wall biosynthesis